MKIKLILIISTFFFVDCSCNKYTNQANALTKSQLSDSFSTSNGFRIFWNDVETDSHGFKKMNQYIPSSNLISKYALKKTDSKYNFSGFIELKKDFDYKAFQKLGGTFVNYSADFQSFSIPINNITDFVQLKGIGRIEMNLKIRQIK